MKALSEVHLRRLDSPDLLHRRAVTVISIDAEPQEVRVHLARWWQPSCLARPCNGFARHINAAAPCAWLISRDSSVLLYVCLMDKRTALRRLVLFRSDVQGGSICG